VGLGLIEGGIELPLPSGQRELDGVNDGHRIFDFCSHRVTSTDSIVVHERVTGSVDRDHGQNGGCELSSARQPYCPSTFFHSPLSKARCQPIMTARMRHA